jgi:hypothetical protein
MAVELQIEARALSDITTRTLQSQLNTTCFAAFGDAHVDHANVVFGPVAQTANAGCGTSIYRVSHSPDDGHSRVECSCVSHE